MPDGGPLVFTNAPTDHRMFDPEKLNSLSVAFERPVSW
jgi:hypothetical protein